MYPRFCFHSLQPGHNHGTRLIRFLNRKVKLSGVPIGGVPQPVHRRKHMTGMALTAGRSGWFAGALTALMRLRPQLHLCLLRMAQWPALADQPP